MRSGDAVDDDGGGGAGHAAAWGSGRDSGSTLPGRVYFHARWWQATAVHAMSMARLFNWSA